MTTERDIERVLERWLEDGIDQMPDRTYLSVLDRVERQPQQPAWRVSWRDSHVNTYLKPLIAIAAVVVIAVAGIAILGRSSDSNVGGPASASPIPSPSAAPSAEPSTTVWTGLPEGPFVVTGTDDPVQITVDIASPDWVHGPEFDYMYKNDDGLDSPESVGGALIAWAWPAGTGLNVYGDPCHWSTTIPATPATTPDEIAAAFMDQAETDATTPVDVTVGGYSGKAVTLHVPMSYHQEPDVARDVEFAACDQSIYGFYGIEGGTEPDRNAQGPSQVDELWILDVNGSIVILDATYGPATPAELVEEMRAMAESATFRR